jgi:hypothetical protein
VRDKGWLVALLVTCGLSAAGFLIIMLARWMLVPHA